MGFFIQARSITEDRADRIIGSFDPVKDSRVSSLIDCPDGINVSAYSKDMDIILTIN